MPEHLKLVLVDDDPAHARLFERTLHRAGIRNRIVHVLDGATALELLFAIAGSTDSGAPEPLLIVLDINMPGVDGYQVLRRIKTDDNTRHIPVIVLTTTQEQQEVTRCRALGCDAVLFKPLDLSKFLQATEQLNLTLERADDVTSGKRS